MLNDHLDYKAILRKQKVGHWMPGAAQPEVTPASSKAFKAQADGEGDGLKAGPRGSVSLMATTY